MEKNRAATDERLEISLEISREKGIQLGKELLLSSCPLDDRSGVSHGSPDHRRSLPPLMSIVAPVMKPATGLATKTMQRAISSGVAKRCTRSLVSA